MVVNLKTTMTNPTFRLLDFQIKNEKGKGKKGKDNKEFIIGATKAGTKAIGSKYDVNKK